MAAGVLSEEAALQVLPSLRGAFSFVFMDERSVYAARDPLGIRPLSIGRLPERLLLRLRDVRPRHRGATLVREVEPGELVRIDDRGLHSARFAETPRAALCIFEFVYLARPDSRLLGTVGARGTPRDGPPARAGASDRGRHGHRRPADRPLRRRKGMRSSRDPVRRRA